MKSKSSDVDQYILQFPVEVQDILTKVRGTIVNAAPDSLETIGYGMPTFKLKGKNLVHFAGYKKHIGFYPSPAGIEKFKTELESYKTSKGAIQFPLDRPIPYDLIKKITEYRVSQTQG